MKEKNKAALTHRGTKTVSNLREFFLPSKSESTDIPQGMTARDFFDKRRE
jgi:hypothetical protein